MLKFFVIYLFLIIGNYCKESENVIHVNSVNFENDFYTKYKNYTETGKKSIELENMIKLLVDKKCRDKIVLTDIPKATEPQECLKCRALANVMINFHRSDKTTEFLKIQAKELCKSIIGEVDSVCDGTISLNSPIIEYILKENQYGSSEKVCNIVGQAVGCSTNYTYDNFKVNLDKIVPASFNNIRINKRSYSDPLTIVQITDIHYDPYYNPGGNAVCDENICCRLHQGKPKDPANSAGKWGDYRNCDSPWSAVLDIIQSIKKQYKHIDYIYFTGDIIDHFTWETTKNGNLESMRKFFKLLKDEFNEIPIFPIIGNHEAHPSNLYSPPNLNKLDISVQWLYDYLIDEWAAWLPAHVNTTVKQEGFYTVLIRTGFRLIALNNNVCYGGNWWLMHNTTLFTSQLQWLHDVLYAAALNNEFVHIIGHVPSNDPMCFVGWTREYRKIIEKFSYLITGQFNGHSHYDEFVLFYDSQNISKPINVAWNGASGTPFTNLNPNYRVYKVNPVTYDVIDFDTWIYNLTEANLNETKSPRWFKEYSFKNAYQLQDLSLMSLDGLINQFSRDKSFLTKYWEYKIKLADPQLDMGCDDLCLKETLCDIVRVQYDDHRKCDELTRNF